MCAALCLLALCGCQSSTSSNRGEPTLAELLQDATVCPGFPYPSSWRTITGVISAIDGEEATLELLAFVSADPEVGTRFAIFDPQGYRGEATMLGWNGERTVRCKLQRREPVALSTPIAVGMRAATNLDQIQWLEGTVAAVDGDRIEITPAATPGRDGWIVGAFVLGEVAGGPPCAIADVVGDQWGARMRAQLREPKAAVRVGMRAWTVMTSLAEWKVCHRPFAVPPLRGVVREVAGRTVTIAITENPTGAPVRRGYSFALYDARGYHGEARVVEVGPGNTVRCSLWICRGTIEPGTAASTRVPDDVPR